jgi:superfamily I DNA/RNA helicase
MEIDKYLEQAENILLTGGTFEDERNERKDFIKNLQTCDLIAVPGSGKTTALLAKLYCIAQNMPFEDGAGILILSHTNKAIEEVEKRLKNYCPKLFEYPNFIGTVQAFVNKSLTNQACFEKYGTYIKKNDDELVLNIIINKVKSDRTLLNFLNSKKRDNETLIDVIKDIKYTPQNFYCARFGRSRTLSFTSESGRVLKNIHDELRNSGYIFFYDSFELANNFLENHPDVKNILQKRFKYVFIDEMQDLEDFQINIIDDVFFSNSSQTIIQRIGDKNQSIYNSVKENCDWKTRQETYSENYTDLSIQNSKRLSPAIANLVDKFVLNRPENYTVTGKFEESTIPPHLILIDHYTTGESLKAKFKEIIEEHNLHSDSKNLEKGFHIISWTTEKENNDTLCLKKLFPEFSKESKKKKDDFDCLKKYLFLFDREKPTLEAIRKSILNALITILDLENIKNEDGKFYTKRQLINFIRNRGEEFYNDFNGKLFKWCFEIVTNENYSEIYGEIKNFIESENFIGLNWYDEEQHITKRISESREFINKNFPFTSEIENETGEIETNGYPINLSSVHSVKGQTHCATLYIESAYQRPTYETQKKKIIDILKGSEHNINSVKNNSYSIQAIKMMYVGFSRPTHLLCFAILKENIEEHIESLKIENDGMWKVVEDLVDNR